MKALNPFITLAACSLISIPLTSCKEEPAQEPAQGAAQPPAGKAEEEQAEPNPFDFDAIVGIPREPEHNEALIDAIAAKDTEAVKKQLAEMSPQELDTLFYIEIAAEDCPPEIVEMLIEAHPTPESRKEAGNAALNAAAQKGNVELVRHLISKKTGDPAWAAAWAAENGDAAMTDLLIDAGAEPDAALCAAAMHGQSDLVRHLLDDKEANANAVDATLDTTVLCLALQADPANTHDLLWDGKIQTLEILLQHGADPKKGKPLVELCASWSWVAPAAREKALALLLAAGAPALDKDREGRTPRQILTAQRDSEPENAAAYDKAIELLRAAEEKAGEFVL